MDAFGNYTTGLASASEAASFANAAIVHGNGPPGADVPSWALGYIDDLTGSFYIYSNGSWGLLSGDVSGVTGVYTSASDPTGSLSVTGAALCLGTGAFDGYLWKKTSAGLATDWVQM